MISLSETYKRYKRQYISLKYSCHFESFLDKNPVNLDHAFKFIPVFLHKTLQILSGPIKYFSKMVHFDFNHGYVNFVPRNGS